MNSTQEITSAIENIRSTRFVTAAGIVILLYDHMLTFADEIEYIWKARPSLARTLFLVLRYSVPFFIVIYNATGLSGINAVSLPNNFCKGWIIATACLGQMTLGISNVIVLLRLWVLWGRDLRLMKLTAGWFILCQLASLATLSYSAKQLADSLVFDESFDMCIFSHDVHIFALWVPGLVFEVMVFMTAFVYWASKPQALSDTARAVYRNGLVYFLVFFVLRLLNTVLAIVAPPSLAFVGVFFIWCASTVTTTRLVLNLRSYSSSHVLIREPQTRSGF